LKLTITTPFAILVEAAEVTHLRAEDPTGQFGILPGHADFLTALIPSVVSWRDAGGTEHYIAVRGGVLEVSGGDKIAIAAPEAVADDDLARLEGDVVTRLRRRQEEEQAAHTDAQRLYVAALHQMVRFLRGKSRPAMPGAPLGPGDGFTA